MGGADKSALVVGGRTLLERALDATAHATKVVVVGPRRVTPGPAVWTQEQPAGGGPVAAIAAGLELTSSELVAVVAVDLPYLVPDDLSALAGRATGRDGAILVDGEGRDQPLAGVYRAAILRRALHALGTPQDASMRALVDPLDLARLVDARAARDCDTPADLEVARADLKGR
jgi:molybdopterin-guanine dinucleotide biosynthesis protein A